MSETGKSEVTAGTPSPERLGCAKDRLMKLSGSMVLGMGLPTEEDQHFFCVSTPKKERKAFIDMCRRVERQCIEWGMSVADIARELPRH